MKSRPILFSTEMVQVILDGNKTQTRRPLKPQPEEEDAHAFFLVPDFEWSQKRKITNTWSYFEDPQHGSYPVDDDKSYRCPYGLVGDQLWVRETFVWEGETKYTDISPIGDFYYKADFPDGDGPTKWKPSIFMPREASRITLEITEIRVERLLDISYQDAKAEGVEYPIDFYKLWEKINGKGSWEANPWVWKITFKRIEE